MSKICDEFLRFLRDNHALEEYKEEVIQSSNYQYSLDTVLNETKLSEENATINLIDGWFVNYDDSSTPIVWSELNEKWLKILAEKYNIGA